LVAPALAALFVSACVTTRGPAPNPTPVLRGTVGSAPVLPTAPPSEPEGLRPLTSLRGWAEDDHLAAWNAFRDGCGAAQDPDTAAVCREARAMGRLDADQARRFFEANFRVQALPGEGVLTAYFAPEYPARRGKTGEFTAPVRSKPADLNPGGGGDYPDRAAIEADPPQAALAWMRPEDLFFLQVQGSGVLAFEDGARMKALYAANNGRPFVAISGPMRERGLLAADNTSADAIHAWLAAHRGPEADAIMRLNPRYAFFRLAPDDGRHPAGTANVALPPGRALAVDPAFHPMGELLWVDGEAPILKGAPPTYRRLALALDTGGAIKGPVRADLYLGQGAAAGVEAGRVRHSLRLYRLVPRPGLESSAR
jgi:membrane-bound lytic murein transglycosylase A